MYRNNSIDNRVKHRMDTRTIKHYCHYFIFLAIFAVQCSSPVRQQIVDVTIDVPAPTSDIRDIAPLLDITETGPQLSPSQLEEDSSLAPISLHVSNTTSCGVDVRVTAHP